MVAQFGKLRALPRRLGLTGGTLNIDLDPLTGALVSIETKMGEGGPAAVGSVLAEIDRDVALEKLKEDQAALELEAKRCASLRTLRRPLPPECPETAGP